MAKILELYEGDKKIKEQPKNTEGKTTITIEGLDSDTDYPKGTYKVAWSENGKVSKKADVPEFKTKPIAVTGVKLDKSTLSLEEGATGNLVATVEPSTATDKTVTFASSDKEIATVDNTGKVTAVKAGNADITVTTKDGSKTAKCTLTVTAKTIAVTGVTIAPKTASVDVDATTKLNSTVAPSTATNKSVSYKSSDDAIATVSSNGTVTGVSEGDATITVTTQDGNKTDTATVTVNAVEEPEPEVPEEPEE